MNRTIKFRAWDGKQMHYSYIIAGAEYCNVLTILQDEEFAKKYYKVDEWKVMQFTGLLDCEGKEIWESDIVMLNHWKSTDLFNYSKPFIVTYYEGEINFKQGDYNNFKGSLVGKLDIKVLGNLYEHPNLLNNES